MNNLGAAAERVRDVASRRQVEHLAALLDYDNPPWTPGELPPLAHWLLYPLAIRQSALGPDGHPPTPEGVLPRRVWAGSRLRFLAPVPLGADLLRETTQFSFKEKTGLSGRMQLLTLRHVISVNGHPAIEEAQDIIYREPPAPGDPARQAPPAEPAKLPMLQRRVTVDPVQLFRFSALTSNAHRIHYDLPYAEAVEGYPGLVVHGPYIAIMLMDLFLQMNRNAAVTSFAFRASRPIFAGEPFKIGLNTNQGGGDLMAVDTMGGLAMQAHVSRI